MDYIEYIIGIKTKLPFGIAAELFWTIFAAIVAVSFLLGLYFGQAKFDKEKSDFYEENKQLKLYLNQKEKQIEKLKKEIVNSSITANKTKMIEIKKGSL